MSDFSSSLSLRYRATILEANFGLVKARKIALLLSPHATSTQECPRWIVDGTMIYEVMSI